MFLTIYPKSLSIHIRSGVRALRSSKGQTRCSWHLRQGIDGNTLDVEDPLSLFTVRLLRARIYFLGAEYINAVIVVLRGKRREEGERGLRRGERRNYIVRPMGSVFRTHDSEGLGDVRSKNGSVQVSCFVDHMCAADRLVMSQQQWCPLLLIALT